jgi:uncharacterized protein YeaO (DUF488 family)
MRPVDRELSTGAPWRAFRVTTRSHTSSRHGLAIKYVRDPVSPEDGERILIDRLWPRGVSKERAGVSEWLRELAPSTELRRWFGHDRARWSEFRRRYRRELADRGQLEVLRGLRDRSRREKITLVFGASDREHNDGVALLEFADGV